MSTTRPEQPAAQRGFALVAAIFILVVLSALGGYILSTSSTQHLSLAQDAMNSRAAQASRTGIEWATYSVSRTEPDWPVCSTVIPLTYRCRCQDPAAGYTGATPAAQVFATGDLAGLGEFRVDISCRSQAFDEAGATYRVYQLVATACTTAGGCPSTSPPAIGYVEHRQSATVRQ